MKNTALACSSHTGKDVIRDLSYETPDGSAGSDTSETSEHQSKNVANISNPPLPHLSPLNVSQTCRNKLSLTPLVILIFYNVSGGPFGIEATIKAGGNFLSILGFAILPFVWSIPEALVTAELGSAFPKDASGGVAWVEDAFGERMGLVSGYLGWISGATDNAIYPTLFLEYLVRVLQIHTTAGNDDDYVTEGEFSRFVDYLQNNTLAQFFFVAILSVLLAGINYTGLEIVGAASLWVCIISMTPFVIFCLVGFPYIEPSKWLQFPEADETAAQYDGDGNTPPQSSFVLGAVLWRPYLNNLFWNLNSFDAAASFAGEVDDLKNTYPRGLFWGFIMCYIFYLIPLLVAIGATDSKQEDWIEGHFATVATEIGGSWLGRWIVFAAGLSNLALFEAEMSADAYMIMGMADRGILPRIFQKRSERYGTPTYGILLGLAVIVIMSVADFSQLVEILNFNYAISLVMEYAAFVKLRYTRRDLLRPFKIPIPDWAAILLVLPPCIGIFIIFAISSWITNVFVFCVAAVGLVLYKLRGVAQERNWCEFDCRDYITIELDESSDIL